MDPKDNVEIHDPGTSSTSPVQIDPASLTQRQPVSSGEPIEMAGASTLTAAEAAIVADDMKALLQSGAIKQSDFDEWMAESGAKPDTRTPAQVEFDRAN